MYVGAVPEGNVEPAQALVYGQSFQGKQRTEPCTRPGSPLPTRPAWATTRAGRFRPWANALGVYARIDRGRGVWKAPAGDEANLAGVLDVSYRLTDAEHTQLVKEAA